MNTGFFGFPNPPRVRGTKDWALGILVTANVGINSAASITDGTDSTWQTATTVSTPQIFSVDLGVRRYITHCRMSFATGPNDTAQDGALQYSDNVNGPWTTVSQWGSDRSLDRTLPVNAWGRYWRVYASRTGNPGATGVQFASWELRG